MLFKKNKKMVQQNEPILRQHQKLSEVYLGPISNWKFGFSFSGVIDSRII